MIRWARVAAVGLVLPILAFPPPGRAQTSVRLATPSSLYLELNGTVVGPLRAAFGGDAEAEVVTEKSGGDLFPKKHIASVHYQDLELSLGAGMDPSVYEWIAGCWAGKGGTVSGAVLRAAYDNSVIARQEFTGTLISTTIPELDAASKEPASLKIVIRPEKTRLLPGSGTIASNMAVKAQKLWTAAAFRVAIDPLDCTRVRKIGPIVVSTEPGRVEVKDFEVSLPEAYSESWSAWLQSFVVNGQSSDGQEKEGHLTLLTPSGQGEIARIPLYGVGIAGLTRGAGSASEAIRSVTARLYCERIGLEWKGEAGATMNVRVFSR